jgi:chaperonin GroEL
LIRDIQPAGFGRARRVILSTNAVTLAGGTGEPRAIQQRIAGVKAALKQASREQDSQGAWDLLRVRLARLSGGIGVLKLGAANAQEMESQQAQINKARRILELAYAEGVVPGGGSAFLACLPTLQQLCPRLPTLDEQAGLNLVEAALTAPFLQIVRNHGELHPPLALETVQRLGTGYGFDALRGEYACMAERHILDALSVARGSLEAAASVATMIMSTDTLVFNA